MSDLKIRKSANAGRDGANAVYGGILEAISRQRLAPGTKLPEEGLSQVFGVSRAQVRSALANLRQRGLVQMEPNKTAQISEPSASEVLELFSVRSWLEPELAAEVARNLTDEQDAMLKGHLQKEQAARDAGDRIEATRLAGLFHTAIASCSSNAIARKYIEELVDRSFLAIYLYQRVGEVMCVNEDHSNLLDAFAARDGDAAAKSMREHLAHVLTRLDLETDEESSPDLTEAFRGIV
ncbi:GntR family transcriptional regulator [Oricola indica]|jgi:DNA-binding GntR family transcriptional regulator|uniref:GntR family transcriptional regulator n=1 Tax=Oricola indica TaxID=2872591 RepID=UPI001CBC8F60|nr:GntR family transcriptional regulator [Oricola indica]